MKKIMLIASLTVLTVLLLISCKKEDNTVTDSSGTNRGEISIPTNIPPKTHRAADDAVSSSVDDSEDESASEIRDTDMDNP